MSPDRFSSDRRQDLQTILEQNVVNSHRAEMTIGKAEILFLQRKGETTLDKDFDRRLTFSYVLSGRLDNQTGF